MMRRALSAAAWITLALAMAPSCVLVAESGASVELLLRVEGAALAEGWLHVADARLVRCEDGELSTWLRPSRARALHPGRAERLGEPQLVALHQPETPLGRVHPPPARYCELELFVTPAEALQGWTLLGRHEGFALRGHGMRVWRLRLPEPMPVGPDGRSAGGGSVELVVHVERALEGLDLSGEHAGLDLLLALEATAEVSAR